MKFLPNVVSYTQLPFLGDYVKILASLKNAYGPPLVSDKQQDEQLGQQILTMKSKPHHVMEYIGVKF